MTQTTNYGFNIVEGTDLVNPLTQLNPNFTALDADLKAIADLTIDNATCIKTGTVHAVTRTNQNANVFRFTATGNWNTGDTMTVDGALVSIFTSDGSAPSDGCFIINTEVLAAIQGSRVTIYVSSTDATNVSFNDASVSFTASNVQGAINALNNASNIVYAPGVSVKDNLDGLNDFHEINEGSGMFWRYCSKPNGLTDVYFITSSTRNIQNNIGGQYSTKLSRALPTVIANLFGTVVFADMHVIQNDGMVSAALAELSNSSLVYRLWSPVSGTYDVIILLHFVLKA